MHNTSATPPSPESGDTTRVRIGDTDWDVTDFGSDPMQHTGTNNVLDMLAEENVLRVRRDGDKWNFSEGCDGWYSVDMTAKEVEQLALELLALVGAKRPLTIFDTNGNVRSVVLVSEAKD